MRLHTTVLSALSIFASVASVQSSSENTQPHTIALVVIDSQTTKPLAHAMVSLIPANVVVQTDSVGRARFRLAEKCECRLTVRAFGHEAYTARVSIADSTASDLIVLLSRSTAALTPVIAGTEKADRLRPPQ